MGFLDSLIICRHFSQRLLFEKRIAQFSIGGCPISNNISVLLNV
ncbi:unnamed protein product [Schistosoma curassoni]|uniref:Uncharacterized protein n=1 Tax=Schistosoma curassoni TaxID=6186 RepID=A0A183JXX1_9TREM|nr:unnamed protein product [Schistosoma curassoni]